MTAFNVGSKVRIEVKRPLSTGLWDRQVFVAEITENDGSRCKYKVLHHEVKENSLRVINDGGFVIGSAGVEVI